MHQVPQKFATGTVYLYATVTVYRYFLIKKKPTSMYMYMWRQQLHVSRGDRIQVMTYIYNYISINYAAM